MGRSVGQRETTHCCCWTEKFFIECKKCPFINIKCGGPYSFCIKVVNKKKMLNTGR